MLRRNGPVVKSVESVLRLEGSNDVWALLVGLILALYSYQRLADEGYERGTHQVTTGAGSPRI